MLCERKRITSQKTVVVVIIVVVVAAAVVIIYYYSTTTTATSVVSFNVSVKDVSFFLNTETLFYLTTHITLHSECSTQQHAAQHSPLFQSSG